MKMDCPHVSIERAVAFVLQNGEFDVSEEEHLLQCDDCQLLMMEALNDALMVEALNDALKNSDEESAA